MDRTKNRKSDITNGRLFAIVASPICLAAIVALTSCRPSMAVNDHTVSQSPSDTIPTGPLPGAPKFALVIHGGAGTIKPEQMTPELETQYRATLNQALDSGYRVLERGGASLDAVIAAIVVLEDSPLFNAGKGAVFTAAGTNELDASLMNGATLAAGAVAGVRHVRNPILLARAIMEKSPHVMMVGAGAEEFAKTQGITLVDSTYFFTDRRWQDYLKAKAKADSVKRGLTMSSEPSDQKFGTVGAVALDQNGNLAAGTSTGGMTMKLWGRVGDSPIIGAGTFANNASCAVSATGHGEFFIRNNVAADICARVFYAKMSLKDAAESVVLRRLVGQKADGGVIAIDRSGAIAMPFNTTGMYRGYRRAGEEPIVKIFADK